MKNLILIFALIGLFGCGSDEEVKPLIDQTTAKLTVTTNVKTAVALAYMDKSHFISIEPYIVEKIIYHDTTFYVKINEVQNFGYFVNRLDDPKAHVTVNLKYREYDKTKTYQYEGGILWDIYEFYKQPMVE